jgi:hypothetical protein
VLHVLSSFVRRGPRIPLLEAYGVPTVVQAAAFAALVAGTLALVSVEVRRPSGPRHVAPGALWP